MRLLGVQPGALRAQILRAQLLDVKPGMLFEGRCWVCSLGCSGHGRFVRSCGV